MSRELRYAEMLWGRELDEIVYRDDFVHVENGGDHVFIGDGTSIVYVVMSRMPREMWWDEVVDAWYERRLPHFWRTELRLMDEWKAT